MKASRSTLVFLAFFGSCVVVASSCSFHDGIGSSPDAALVSSSMIDGASRVFQGDSSVGGSLWHVELTIESIIKGDEAAEKPPPQQEYETNVEARVRWNKRDVTDAVVELQTGDADLVRLDGEEPGRYVADLDGYFSYYMLRITIAGVTSESGRIFAPTRHTLLSPLADSTVDTGERLEVSWEAEGSFDTSISTNGGYSVSVDGDQRQFFLPQDVITNDEETLYLSRRADLELADVSPGSRATSIVSTKVDLQRSE